MHGPEVVEVQFVPIGRIGGCSTTRMNAVTIVTSPTSSSSSSTSYEILAEGAEPWSERSNSDAPESTAPAAGQPEGAEDHPA